MVGNNSLPFTIYSAKNATSAKAGTYLGKASKKTNEYGSVDYFPSLARTCTSVFVFARIVGTRNTKITRPTVDNPYIYISTRGYFVEKIPGYESTSILRDYTNYTATLRTIATDGSIVMSENVRHDYHLEALTYDFDNVCNINGLFYRRLGVPGKSDVVWMMKTIRGSDYMSVNSTEEEVIVNFNDDAFGNATDVQCVDDTRGEYPFERWNTPLIKESCKE